MNDPNSPITSVTAPAPPHVSLQAEFFRPDILRIDVTANNLPAQFLGTAFDLKVPGTWQFERDELCGVFSRNDPNVFHLVSAQPEQRRVVFGLTVVGERQIQDGCLASFYFRYRSISSGPVVFDHTAMSLYRNGRHDLTNVAWEGIFLEVPQSLSQQELSASQQDFVQAATQQQMPQNRATNFEAGSVPAQTDFLHSVEPSLVGVYMVILVTLCLFLAVFALSLAYFRFRRRK